MGSATATYVFTVPAVQRAVQKLGAVRSHEHLPGYLAIFQAHRRSGGEPVRAADIVDFHERYLSVRDAPEGLPYLRPFRSRGTGAALMNPNVAGSYAPSSIRSGGRLPEVIDVVGQGRDAIYILRPDHAMLMLTRVLGNHKIPVASIAVFLLRDYGFSLEARTFTNAMKAFRAEFYLRPEHPEERAVYDTLFEDDMLSYSDDDLALFGDE